MFQKGLYQFQPPYWGTEEGLQALASLLNGRTTPFFSG